MSTRALVLEVAGAFACTAFVTNDVALGPIDRDPCLPRPVEEQREVRYRLRRPSMEER